MLWIAVSSVPFLDKLNLVGRHAKLGSPMPAFFIGDGGGIFVWDKKPAWSISAVPVGPVMESCQL